MDDTISRRAAIDALWKALYEYEDDTEKKFQESEELDVGDWFQHRIFVQNMSGIDIQTILNLPSAQQNRIARETAGKSPKEIYDFLYWLMFDYARQFTDSRLAVIEWLKEERREDD